LFATLAALLGAVIWSVGIGLTIAAYNQNNTTDYALHSHFISELGMPATSRLTWLFNLSEAIGSLASLPIVCALAMHLRTKLATIAACFAAVAFLAASGLGILGLQLDVQRPEHLSLTFLGLHLGGAAVCFGCWAVAVTLFTVTFMRRRADAASRGMVVIGILCIVVAALLFGAAAFAVRELAMQSVHRDPIYRTIFHSQATPQTFNAWLESYRPVFGALSTMEWSLLGTIMLWHGAVIAFLWVHAKRSAPANSLEEENSEQRRAQPTPADRSVAVARCVSIVGHPFTFIVLLLLLPFLWRGQLNALRITGVVTLAALVPLGLFMRQRFLSGRWQTVDASDRRDRPVAYLAAFAALVPVLIYFFAVERAPVLVRGCLVIGAMMAVGAGVNRWIKGSGHMAFAAFSAVVLARLHPGFTIGIALFMPGLGWSRLKLQRHTLIEVIGGAVLGLLAGAAMFLF
jgi:hypothetical protein